MIAFKNLGIFIENLLLLEFLSYLVSEWRFIIQNEPLLRVRALTNSSASPGTLTQTQAALTERVIRLGVHAYPIRLAPDHEGSCGAGALLLGIVVSSAVAVILAADSVMDEAREELIEYEHGAQRHIEYHSEIRNAIGYGGFIHSFKNFLLRGDAEYRGAVTEDYHRLTLLIDRFETIATDQERQALESLRGVLARYIENFRIAQRMQAEGRPPEEIDRALGIDDGPAVEALDLLEDQWLESTGQGATRLNDAILRGKSYVEIGWFFVPLFLSSVLFSSGLAGRLSTSQSCMPI